MIDISPVIQFKIIEGKKCLLDLINNNIFEISEFKDLRFILELIDSLPNDEKYLISIMEEDYEKEYVHNMFHTLKSNHILMDANLVNPIKVKVQEWVDSGWTDALVLHLSSRNLKYFDDPLILGGDDNLTLIPDYKTQNIVISEKDFNLNRPNTILNSDDILNAINNRRSFLPFNMENISLKDLESILWFANEYSRDLVSNEAKVSERNLCFDSAFSALDTYIVIYADNFILKQGVYKYNSLNHSLTPISIGDFRGDLAKLAIGQRRASAGLFSILITGDWYSYSKRYNHERSYRNLLINTAQLAQYYLILGTHFGYNTFMTPAMLDEDMYKFLKLDKEYPLYITTFG